MAVVHIKDGSYRNNSVGGTFELLKPWKEGAKGGFVTVLNDGTIEGSDKGSSVRVKVEKDNIEVVGEIAGEYRTPNARKETPVLEETDDEIVARFDKTFSFVEKMTAAAQKGQILGLVITGPAGIGKSYTVERTLERLNLGRKLSGRPEQYEVITGGTSAPGLYMKLWQNRNPGQVLVFDDCDDAFFDQLQLNMLKAAMDTKKKRTICWMKDKSFKDEEGERIPESFVYEGSIVFLTNMKFDNCRSQKLAGHLEAIMSRIHYMDLRIDTLREQLLRVKQVVKNGMLDDRDLSEKQKEDVVQYVYDNVEYLHELSLRTVIKVADLAQIAPRREDWEEIADETLLSKKGLVKKKLDQKEKEAA